MPAQAENELLQAALSYAKRGWWVFPLHSPRPGGRCSCNNSDCDRQGKHPRTRNGLNDATIDPERITSWWEMWPDANIGVSCGPSGLVTIDVDHRHGGDESYRDLVQKHGPQLTATVTALTGGGGEHYVFACPPNEHITNVVSSDRYTGPLGRGVDVRGYGGYIVIAPSLHVSGAFYEWASGASPEDIAPSPLPFALFELLKEPVRPQSTLGRTADILAGIEEGQRDFTLFQLASRLRAADVPYDMALELIYQAAANCKPPFSPKEAEKRVLSAYRRYEPRVGTYQEPVGLPQHEDGLEGRALLWPLISGGVPAPDWTISDVLLAGHVHLLYGEPGCGKTILLQHWFRQMFEAGRPSIFIDEESGAALIAARFAAMGVSRSIDQHLHYFPFANIGIADADELVAYCARVGAAIVGFDSMADVLNVSGLDENSALDVTRWMMGVAVRIARTTGAAVVILDHSGKDATSTKYSRGTGAKKAKSDVAWFVDKTADFDTEREGRVILRRMKNRPGYIKESVAFMLGGRNGSLVVERFEASQHGITTLKDDALEILRYLRASQPDWVRSGEIATGCRLSQDSVGRRLRELAAGGMVAAQGLTAGNRTWIITDEGGSAAEAADPLRIRSGGTAAPRGGSAGGEVETPLKGGSPPCGSPTAAAESARKQKQEERAQWWT